jgi:integrase
LGEDKKINDLTLGKVESYQRLRLSEPSPRHLGKTIRPATVNKEVTCLKTVLNRAVRHEKLSHNPIEAVKKLPENNVRMRFLNEDEFETLLSKCAWHIRTPVLMAYYMGLRRSEAVRLRWSEVDFKKGFIRLPEDRTKPKRARAIPIHPRVREALSRIPKGLHTDRVFLKDGKPFNEIKKSFKSACRRAGIEDFTFHDLRHCALNNLRLAGNDYFRIMSLSGHKTMSVFKRYNLVTEEELSQIKWKDEEDKSSSIDTYKDTKKKKG